MFSCYMYTAVKAKKNGGLKLTIPRVLTASVVNPLRFFSGGGALLTYHTGTRHGFYNIFGGIKAVYLQLKISLS